MEHTIDIDHIEVPTIRIEYKGYTITEESSFGTPWKIVDPKGNVVNPEPEFEDGVDERHLSVNKMEREFQRREYLADED